MIISKKIANTLYIGHREMMTVRPRVGHHPPATAYRQASDHVASTKNGLLGKEVFCLMGHHYTWSTRNRNSQKDASPSKAMRYLLIIILIQRHNDSFDHGENSSLIILNSPKLTLSMPLSFKCWICLGITSMIKHSGSDYIETRQISSKRLA